MVRVRQIVVDGFRHADHAELVLALDGLLVDFQRGVLRIISANVKKVADVVRLKHLEQPVHISGRLVGLVFKINFVAARAERRSRVYNPSLRAFPR